MALTSRAQRERDQQRRMARGRRNLTQLVGPQAQGQRTPMNRGSGSVSTVQAPKFQQSNVGDDITQAGLAYKGAKGIHDFTTGTEAYTDKAGNVIPAKAPFSFGDKSILGEGGHVDEYFGKVGNRWDEATEGLTGLFSPDVPASPLTMGANPAYQGIGPNTINPNTPQSLGQLPPTTTASPSGWPDTYMNQHWGNPTAATTPTTGLAVKAPSGMLSGATGATGVGTGATAGSNLLGGGSSAFAGANAAGNTATAVNAATQGAEAVSATAEAGSGLQGASGGQPWLAYANIAKDLIVGGPGSEKITGSTAGDAAIRAAAAYFTFGLSEIPYAFI